MENIHSSNKSIIKYLLTKEQLFQGNMTGNQLFKADTTQMYSVLAIINRKWHSSEIMHYPLALVKVEIIVRQCYTRPRTLLLFNHSIKVTTIQTCICFLLTRFPISFLFYSAENWTPSSTMLQCWTTWRAEMRAVSWSPLGVGRCSHPPAMASPSRKTPAGNELWIWPSSCCLETVKTRTTLFSLSFNHLISEKNI